MKHVLVFLFCALLCATSVFSQPQQSEDFRITKSVIDAGGAASTSEDFQLYSAFGQPTPIGMQSSADFALHAGYLSPCIAVSPLSPIQELVVRVAQPDIILHWEPIDGADRYTIYRDTTATVTPSLANRVGIADDTTFTDLNVIPTLPAPNQFYIVTSHEWIHPLTGDPSVKRNTDAVFTPRPEKKAHARKETR